jgi:uncharacterized protein (TIGR00375 family)
MFAFDLQDMKVIADLHIHGRFSRATSKALDIANLEKWARIKGVSLLGTGDFTHPEWTRELKANLAEDGSGILKTKSGFPFMLQTEICLMYSQGGKGRRVHNIVLAPSFEVVAQITDYLGKNGRLDYDGRPIFKIPCPNFVEMLKNIDDRIEVIPAHVFTPWFSMFGSMSGFDSIKECFQDQAKHIHAIETGLSSDPAMNWRLSQLDNVAIVSFSDCHSFWPWRLGREATVFELKNLSYTALMNSLRTKEGLAETIEFFPEEGKYHYDGHRACNVVMSPQESIKVNDICPVCKKRMTIGVAHRVEELADKDRPLGFKPRGAVPFRSLIPLSEVIAGVSGSPVASRKVWAVYNRLIERFGNELSVLMDAPEGEIAKITEPNIARMIVADRTQKIQFKPGYDGEYGHPLFDGKEVDLHKFDFGSGEKEKFAAPSGNSDRSQKSLVDF